MVNETVQITLPFPPSVNGYWRAFRGRNILSKRGREYREDAMGAIAKAMMAGGFPPLAHRLKVSLDLHPPDARRRDIDNYCKGVLDALTHAGVWLDDEQIDELNILKCPRDKDDPRVVVTITEIEPCNETS